MERRNASYYVRSTTSAVCFPSQVSCCSLLVCNGEDTRCVWLICGGDPELTDSVSVEVSPCLGAIVAGSRSPRRVLLLGDVGVWSCAALVNRSKLTLNSAPYPMFPGRIKQDPRILLLTLLITFISGKVQRLAGIVLSAADRLIGANFFSALMFWPTQAYNVYGHDPVGVGLRTFPAGIAIMVGACLTLYLLTVFRGRNKELMIFSSVIMTAGTASLACATRENMNTLWGLLILSGLGIGGIVVPASIITTIICPDDLIATVSALTLSIRVIGGAVGYCAYYNVFVSKFVPNAIKCVHKRQEFLVWTSADSLTIIVGTLVEQCTKLASRTRHSSPKRSG